MDPQDVRRIACDVVMQQGEPWEVTVVAVEADGLRARLTLRKGSRQVEITVPIGSPRALRAAIGQWLDDIDA